MENIIVEKTEKTVGYKADPVASTLKVTETPVKIIPVEKTYNIVEVKERITKRIVYRDQLQTLIDEDQVILDKYNELTDGGTK